MSNKFDPVEAAKLQPQKPQQQKAKEPPKEELIKAAPEPAKPSAPAPLPKDLPAHMRRYRVLKGKNVVVAQQTTFMAAGQIISFEGFGEANMKRLLEQHLELEELP